jgi:hypothetical protein
VIGPHLAMSYRTALGELQPEGLDDGRKAEPYRRWIRGEARYAGGRLIVHLLDCCSIRRCEYVREIVETPKMDLVFVPAGGAAAPHPCECSVFGAVVAICRPPVLRPGARPQQQDAVREHARASRGCAARVRSQHG